MVPDAASDVRGNAMSERDWYVLAHYLWAAVAIAPYVWIAFSKNDDDYY